MKTMKLETCVIENNRQQASVHRARSDLHVVK